MPSYCTRNFGFFSQRTKQLPFLRAPYDLFSCIHRSSLIQIAASAAYAKVARPDEPSDSSPGCVQDLGRDPYRCVVDTTAWWRWYRSDCVALLNGVCHEEVFVATLFGMWWFVRRDEYTTIVQSKPSQMVPIHPTMEGVITLIASTTSAIPGRRRRFDPVSGHHLESIT